MGKFPNSESDVATLADEMIAGFTSHEELYPAPPVDAQALKGVRDGYLTAKNNAVAAQAAAQYATATKDDSLDTLIEAMKKDIRYAENTVGGNDEMLKFIGWSDRKAPESLSPPGQARLLAVTGQQEGDVDLAWKPPTDGGKPSAYRVVRRERPAGPWTDLVAVFETEASLTDQPRGKEFEYRIIAANKAGDGEPSNTVVVVL